MQLCDAGVMAGLRAVRRQVALAVAVAIGVVLAAATLATEAAGVTSPPGYRIVIANYQAPQSTFTTLGTATCPTGTATWGGGLVWGGVVAAGVVQPVVLERSHTRRMEGGRLGAASLHCVVRRDRHLRE